MKNISIRDFETSRLLIKKPTMNEQFTLWNILKDEQVNKYYFPTPDRIFVNGNLNNKTIIIQKGKNKFLKIIFN